MSELYGVILAAGAGTRLGYPNHLGGKAMALLAHRPLLEYAIEKMRALGIRRIALVVNPENLHAVQAFAKDGSAWEVEFRYIIQPEPLGIAHALGLCEVFAAGHPLALLLVDNVFSAIPSAEVAGFDGRGCHIFLTQVPNPSDYGVAVLADGRVRELVEKPSEPLSDQAVIGLYLYDATVFDRIRELVPSARGEYEITDLNRLYLAADELAWTALDGWWLDIGTPERLAAAEELVKR